MNKKIILFCQKWNVNSSTHRVAAKVFSNRSFSRANTDYVFESGSNKQGTVENNACLPERRKSVSREETQRGPVIRLLLTWDERGGEWREG